MSARQSVYISRIVHAESRPSPNATVAAITAEIRVFYPPGQVEAAIRELSEAYIEALEELDKKND